MFDPERDAELMSRVSKGDRAAFAELFDLYAAAIGKFLYNLTYDRQSAEDGVQEVFLRLWRASPRWNPTGKFTTYLFQIARNWGLSELDRRKRRLPAVDDHDGASKAKAERPEESRSPDEAAALGEEARRIRDAVSGLSDKLRVTFILAVYDELPYAEIAEILEIPVGTVKSRVAAAEKALREKLEEK